MTSKKTIGGKHRITVTVAPEDYDKIRMAAAYLNLSANEYMAKTALEDAVEIMEKVIRK